MNKSLRTTLGVLAIAGLSSIVAVTTTQYVVEQRKGTTENSQRFTMTNDNASSSLLQKASLMGVSGQPIDLTTAAAKSIHAVVHIKSTVNVSQSSQQQKNNDIFEYFFGPQQGQRQQGQRQRSQSQPKIGFGSGVIISSDGYIVTNNHVVAGADEVSVTLNDNRTFSGRIVGTDPSTDLALVKIEGENLPILSIGNSEALKVGEWVLAVGNPFNLTSTVTAGIVSAKARSLGVYNNGIESFIQTDAAINKGNSGGALVNSRGELVGINSILASPTGAYSGYGFAIPSSIMTKVISDLKQYGTVQRAVLGIRGSSVGGQILPEELKAKEKLLGVKDGILVAEVIEDGAASKVGIMVDDVIIGIDGMKITKMAQLQEQLAKHNPGDKVNLKVVRDKKDKTIEVILENEQGTTSVVKKADLEMLGAAFQKLSSNAKRQLGINYGLQVSGVTNGRMKQAGIRRNFIILKINGQKIASTDNLTTVFKNARRSPDQVLFITGIMPSGNRYNYAVDISDSNKK